jgi:hypothetical protein
VRVFYSPKEFTFKHTLQWRLLSLLPVAVFSGLAWLSAGNPNNKEEFLWMLGLTGFFAAVALLNWVLVSKIEISFHQEGIARSSMFGSVEIPWNDIQETRYSQTPINHGVHFGLIGLLVMAAAHRRSGDSASMQRNLKIVGLDGKSITISFNFRDAEEAMRMVLNRVDPPMLEKVLTRIKNGETVAFGNIALNSMGVVWKSKEPVPYASLIKCKIEGTNLGVKAQGKWLNNVSVNLKKVPNIFVFLKAAEQMRTGPQAKAEDYLAASRSFSASAGF